MYLKIAYNLNISGSYTFRKASKEVSVDGEKLYIIKAGRDLNPNKSNEILEKYMPPQSLKDELEPKSYPFLFRHNGKLYEVVGAYEHQYEITNNTYITNDISINVSYGNLGCLPDSEYVITEGRDVISDNEIIVNNHMSYAIGDVISDRYTVVGKYTGSSLAYAYTSLTTWGTAITNHYTENVLFDVVNHDGLTEITSNYGYEYYNDLKCKALLENDS